MGFRKGLFFFRISICNGICSRSHISHLRYHITDRPISIDCRHILFCIISIYNDSFNYEYQIFKPKIFQKEKKWLVIIPVPIIIIYVATSIFLLQGEEIRYDNLFDFLYGVLFTSGSAVTLAFAFLGMKIFREGTMGMVWLLLVIGIFTNTIGDVWYYHLEIFEQYTLLHPVNVFWYSSYWLAIYALYKHRETM